MYYLNLEDLIHFMLISLSLSKLFWVEVVIKFYNFYLCEAISMDLKNCLAKFAPCGGSTHHQHHHLHQQSIRNLLVYKTRTNALCHYYSYLCFRHNFVICSSWISGRARNETNKMQRCLCPCNINLWNSQWWRESLEWYIRLFIEGQNW